MARHGQEEVLCWVIGEAEDQASICSHLVNDCAAEYLVEKSNSGEGDRIREFCVYSELEYMTPPEFNNREVSCLCPQGDSNSCFGLERATSWASRRWGQ